jgi:lysyl-tRNA synthetase class 1
VKGELPPHPERIFALSLADHDADPTVEAARYRPPFAHLALLLQVPGPDPIERLGTEKGAPLDDTERTIALERVAAARAWLEHFAPDSARIHVRDDALPPAVAELDASQGQFLAALADAVEPSPPASGDDWQALIFMTAREQGLKPADAFGSLYRAFLGRPNGPRAGWLLASLALPFVLSRLREAAGSEPGQR